MRAVNSRRSTSMQIFLEPQVPRIFRRWIRQLGGYDADVKLLVATRRTVRTTTERLFATTIRKFRYVGSLSSSSMSFFIKPPGATAASRVAARIHSTCSTTHSRASSPPSELCGVSARWLIPLQTSQVEEQLREREAGEAREGERGTG